MTRKRLRKLLMGRGLQRYTAEFLTLGAHVFEMSYAEYWTRIDEILRRRGR